MARIMRSLISAITGKAGHSPAGKKYLKKKKKARLQRSKKKKVSYGSLRTKGINAKLRKAGLTEEEIRKLRGSKFE